MSEENVVHRNPKSNRRKNTDGYRTDSGCFEDVDLQLATRHSPLSDSPPSESAVADSRVVAASDDSLNESRHATEFGEAYPSSLPLPDECADDKDFHAILKRLADITQNPGDLYRLCFSSRLSFCGHMAGNMDEEGSFFRAAEGDQNDVVVQPTDSCKKCEILSESHLQTVENDSKRSSRGEHYVELLSLLSSFMTKAKENPNVFKHSSLGNSLVHQLSSLLSILEEARSNPKHESEMAASMKSDQPSLPVSPQHPAPIGHTPARQCAEISTPNLTKNKTSLAPESQASGTENIDVGSNDSNVEPDQPSSSSNRRNTNKHFPVSVQKSTLAPSDPNKETDGDNCFTLKNSITNLDKQEPSYSQTQNSKSFPTVASSVNFPNSNAIVDKAGSTLKSSTHLPSKQDFMTSVGSSDFYNDRLHTSLKNAPDDHITDHSLPSQKDGMETSLPHRSHRTVHINRESSKIDTFSNDRSGCHNQQLSPLSQEEELENSLLSSCHGNDPYSNTEVANVDSSSRSSSNRNDKEQSCISNQSQDLEVSLPVSTIKTSLASGGLTSEIDNTAPKWKAKLSNSQDDISTTSQTEDKDTVPDLTDIETRSAANSGTDGTDVITNGRRAVKPYSWDYGDIWEKELERAKSSESFQNGTQKGHSSGKDLMPSFEEIRDELFRNAGFIHDNGSRSDVPKRRSRSADARSALQDDTIWPEYTYTQNEMRSPFVRTVYQNEARPSPGLRRSWSSHHISGDSMMVNVDWTYGRQMRVISGSADQFHGFDDARAQIIKEAVVKTSTYRGPKPWSVLKRRPSGLRRRSARIQSLTLNRCDDSRENPRARSDPDSESSDSPYVSATSSDCLTTATDDSSSVTSSQYYAASSLPSSPSVSNRNSACFSDTSTSDASEIRRVVFQSSSLESVPRGRYIRGYEVPNTRGMSLDQRFGFIQKLDLVPPSEGMETSSLKSLRGLARRAGEFHNEDFSNLQDHCTLPRKWMSDRKVSPLVVRSDSDLNHLTKVHFVGDSYSRSRISKNVRPTRCRSQSSSPDGPRTAHSRVVSCEIVQSDKGKRDVYTKVNIAESLNDAEAKIHDGRTMKLGHPSTRRSWHGQSPTRIPSRHFRSNRSTPHVSRYSNLSSSVLHSQWAAQVKKPVHATLVGVNNGDRGLRAHWSTGSIRLPLSERPRLMSDTVVRNTLHGYPSANCNVHSNFERNFKGSNGSHFGTARAPFGQQLAVGIRPSRRRSPPDYLTAIKQSQGLRKKGRQVGFKGTDGHCSRTDITLSSTHDSPVDKNKDFTNSKEHISHIVKETSFVGPSTFTKYQSSENPAFSRTQRSRSLNEKDTMSRRRLHDSDVYRRRAIELSQSGHGDGYYLNQSSRWESNIADLRRPGRRRRYSEGTKHDTARSEGIVDASYCDPRRDSIREGTYSIVNAESVHNGSKSEGIHTPDQMKCNSSVAATSHGSDETIGLQNGRITRNRRSLNDVDNERMSGIPQLDCVGERLSAGEKNIVESNLKLVEDSKPQKKNDVVTATELPREKKHDGNDFTCDIGQDKKNSDTIGKKDMTSERECRTCITEETILTPVLRYSEASKDTVEHTDAVYCSSSLHRATNERETPLSQSMPNETMIKSNSVVSQILPDRETNEANAVILAKEVSCRNMDETNGTDSSQLPYQTKGKISATDSFQDLQNQQLLAADNKVTLDKDLQYTNIEVTHGVLYQPFPPTKTDETSTGFSHEVFLYKQVDEADEIVSGLPKNLDINRSNSVSSPASPLKQKDVKDIVQPSSLPCKEIAKTVASAEMMPQSHEKADVVLSPVLSNRKANGQSKEVNVFIDYRNKRPVSVEYQDEDVSLPQTFGGNARTLKRSKENCGNENKAKTSRNNKKCSGLSERIPEKSERNVKSEEQGVLPRLSRRDRHEQEVLATKMKNLHDQQLQAPPVSHPQPSPVPYCRDDTIIYTDARTSFGSDTDSISRESTVSSSGSDMTVVLHEDMDISADDLKQLTENGSKIGIEIAPIDVGPGDEGLSSSRNTPVKMPPAMEISTTFKNYPKRISDCVKTKPELVFGTEAVPMKESSDSSEKLGKNLTPKRLIIGQNNACLSHDNLDASSCNVQSSSSSIASSRASSKSTGTDSLKGKQASKHSEGGKGFFSRLKSFRNSFRTKMSGGNSPEKSGKNTKISSRNNNKERRSSQTMSQNVPPSDINANLASRARNRTKSDAGVVSRGETKGDLSRRSYDVFRHPNNNIRCVVGVKSVSSDHLNAYRINNIPPMDEITAKSLEVLVETCI